MISSETKQALESIQDASNFDEAILMIKLHDYAVAWYGASTCGIYRPRTIHRILHMNLAGVYYSPDRNVISLTAVTHWGEIRRTLRWLTRDLVENRESDP